MTGRGQLSCTSCRLSKFCMFPAKELCLFTLFVGHETTGTHVAHVVKRLHDHPEVMLRLREEHAKLRREHGDAIDGKEAVRHSSVQPGVYGAVHCPTSVPNNAANVLSKMCYTDAVLRESLRLSAVVESLYREAVEDIELPGPFRLPKGWRVTFMIGQAMRDIPGKFIFGGGGNQPFLHPTHPPQPPR